MNLLSTARHYAGAVWNLVRDTYLLHVAHDEQTIALDTWRKTPGSENLRYVYPLTNQSTVLDLGGYRGDWAAEIFARYGCRVHIFEPIAEYADSIRIRFRSNSSINVYQFGVGAEDAVLLFDKSGDASRAANVGSVRAATEHAMVRNINSVLSEIDVQRIDLMKINIEGGEYPLLKHMAEMSLISQCRDIQVQFHKFAPNAQTLRADIRNSLSGSHHLTYDYPFVWENWRLSTGA